MTSPRLLLGSSLRRLARLCGYHLLPMHFYTPIPDPQDVARHRFERQPSDWPAIDWREEAQLALLREIAAHRKELYEIPSDPTGDPFQAFARNISFVPPDFDILHLMLRHFKPRRIIEAGSGVSTLLILKALERNAVDGSPAKLRTIDPYPGPLIEAASRELPGRFALARRPVQRVPLHVFESLRDGDWLFIDSSHCARLGSDVNFLFFEVLPRLAPGVMVHFHDILLPHDYLPRWVQHEDRYWNEQYLLHTFLQFNNSFEVMLGTNHLRLQHPEVMRASLVHYDDTSKPGGSFYIRRK